MSSFFVRFVLLFVAVFAALFMLVWFYLSATTPAQAGDTQQGAQRESAMMATTPITIVSQSGQSHTFQVEWAKTMAEQRRGLMFRKNLAADHGMLFDYNPPRAITMWMKNTFLSLDMLFFDSAFRIAHIAAHTEPFSQKFIVAPGLTRYVLEVPAGTAERLGLSLGDRLELR
ncbi:DUF192 domain-containing protein [Magnetovibrio sp.]|uniref:DUF192 domain-containing protein n=1 Tax=Magnetovibrio sp. TaxID=2024836 RepID=UPI002F95AF86